MSNLLEKYNLDYKIIENRIDIKDLFQTIINKNGVERQVLDFDKIFDLPHNYILGVSSRGNWGKTYNSKDSIYRRFKKTGKISYHLRNLSKDLEIEKRKYLSDDCPLNLKENTYIRGSVKKNTLALYENETHKKIVQFQALNTGEDEKGSRILPDKVIYDEFNVNHHRVDNFIEKFDSFIHSTEDIVNNYGGNDTKQVIMFGNNKSLNHPLIFRLGITSIKAPITELYINNIPVLLIFWEFTDDNYRDKFIEENKSNSTFLISMLLGTAEHSYFNESLFDDVNFVYPLIKHWKEKNKKGDVKDINDFLTLRNSIFHKNKYYNIYKINNLKYKTKLDTSYHISIVDKENTLISNKTGKHIIYSLQSKDKNEGVNRAMSSSAKNILSKLLGQNKVSFEDVVSRDIFISSLQ